MHDGLSVDNVLDEINAPFGVGLVQWLFVDLLLLSDSPSSTFFLHG